MVWGSREHIDLLKKNADLSALLQLNIGWDVYCRANEQMVTELPISLAIGSAETVQTFLMALNAVETEVVTAAMESINVVLNTPTGTSTGGTTAAPVPALSNEQIAALEAATVALTSAIASLASSFSDFNTQHMDAEKSATLADRTYSLAVSNALYEAALNNSSTASAVTALVPAAVVTALKNGAE